MSNSDARKQRAVRNLAAALNECFDAATESAAEKAAEAAAEKAAESAARRAAESTEKVAESAARRAADSAARRAADSAARRAAESTEKVAESAARKAADSVKAELKADMYAMEGRLNKRMDDRLDRQDDTLRMIWTQCGGKAQRLPIDP